MRSCCVCSEAACVQHTPSPFSCSSLPSPLPSPPLPSPSLSLRKVTLRGAISNDKIVVERTKNLKKSGNLRVEYCGDDATLQTGRETQSFLGSLIPNSDVLNKCVFFNQHMSNDLLSCTGGAFIESMGFLVGLKEFGDCRRRAGEESRELKRRREGMEKIRDVRLDDLLKLRRKVEEGKQKASAANLAPLPSGETLEESSNAEAYAEVEKWNAKVQEFQLEIENDAELAACRKDVKITRGTLRNITTKLEVCRSALASAKKRLSRANAHDDESCPTCGQNLAGEEEKNRVALVQSQSASEVERLELHASELRKLGNSTASRLDAFVLKQQSIERRHESTLSSARSSLKSAKAQYEAFLSSASSRRRQLDLRESQLREIEYAKRALTEDLEKVDSLEKESFALNETLQHLLREEEAYSATEKIFSPRGVQTFVLNEALEELNYLTSQYLEELSGDTLRLKMSISESGTLARLVDARMDHGEWSRRTLATLSGGQWRRCSLALALAYRELCSNWGICSSNILVLDEPMTHLDREGRRQVGSVLKRMVREGKAESIFLILQDLAAEEMEEATDCVDLVERDELGVSSVIVDW